MREQRGIRLEGIVEREVAGSDRCRSHARLHVRQGYPFSGNGVNRFERAVAQIDRLTQARAAGSELVDREVATAVQLAVAVQREGSPRHGRVR